MVTEETFSIFEREFSIISVSFSSGHANLIIRALRPKAIGFSSKEMFRAPSDSKVLEAFDLISSRFVSGEEGIIFTITATIPAIYKPPAGF